MLLVKKSLTPSLWYFNAIEYEIALISIVDAGAYNTCHGAI
jgi:hypothetical protein